DLTDEKKRNVINEVDILSKLDSINVVQYYNSWFESDYLYIQMEYCPQTLRKVLDDKWRAFGRQSPKEPMNSYEYYILCEIFWEILRCLQYIHELDSPIIHRDIKPANILISVTHDNIMSLKLCDFGLATEHDTKSKSHSRGVGTQGYMAPEIGYTTKYDTKVDIYSAGIIGLEISDMYLR
ncbi:unnamed protein product, partial [Medioppia subpectinata]